MVNENGNMRLPMNLHLTPIFHVVLVLLLFLGVCHRDASSHMTPYKKGLGLPGSAMISSLTKALSLILPFVGVVDL